MTILKPNNFLILGELRLSLFANKVEAGKQLANALSSFVEIHDLIVLAIPRGGVVVGYEVAHALKAP